MTPDELKSARKTLGLNQAEFARVLGYQSANVRNLKVQVSGMETGRKAITPDKAFIVRTLLEKAPPSTP